MSETRSLPITQWSIDDRPREKLLLKGNIALSDAELLAILLGSGSKNESAVALAKRILSAHKHNLNLLARLSVNELQKFKGVGQAKAVRVVAALELGRRRRLETVIKNPTITNSRQVYELMQPILGDLSHEEFWVIYLNNSNTIITKEQISKGGLTTTTADSRLIYKKAIEVSATAIILCHNHPSQKTAPSKSDKELTKKMTEAGKLLSISVLDHLILTEDSYFSFADENLIIND